MPDLTLRPLASGDLEALTDFEFGNRAFFEAHINARAPAYYAAGGVQAAIAAAIRESSEDKAYQFLAFDQIGTLVARVNLTRVRRDHFHSAELGYRVAQAQGGKGFASEAVGIALRIAFGELGLHRVEANARPGNPASVKVLLRNGFTQYGRSSRSFQLAGEWHDLCHFECHADAWEPL